MGVGDNLPQRPGKDPKVKSYAKERGGKRTKKRKRGQEGLEVRVGGEREEILPVGFPGWNSWRFTN